MIQFHVVGVSSAAPGSAARAHFASPYGDAFDVEIPPGQTDAVRQALDGTSSQQQLDAWLLADLFDGDLTEVLIEEHTDYRDFSLVFSLQGLLMRFSVTPLDAVLTGLRLGAPFLMARHPRAAQERLPVRVGPALPTPRQLGVGRQASRCRRRRSA